MWLILPDESDYPPISEGGWKLTKILSVFIKMCEYSIGLEDKVTACEMIVCFARELKESFAGYVERVMQLMLPLLRFLFHEGVRSGGILCCNQND